MSGFDGLAVENVTVNYHGLTAVESVSIEVPKATIISVLGANGAGKSSLLKAIAGVVPVSRGTISFEGRRLNKMRAHQATRHGISLVPETRELFPQLSVEMNLRLGAYSTPHESDRMYVEVLELFPILGEKRSTDAGSLSGGQQQMLGIARGLMSAPRLLLLDEPSLGVAPITFREILEKIQLVSSAGTAVLLVEQNAAAALSISSYAYILRGGSLIASGSPEEIHDQGLIVAGYLGG